MSDMVKKIAEMIEDAKEQGIKAGLEMSKQYRKKNHKFQRGQKFTIEIAEVHTHYSDGLMPMSLYRIKGFSSLVFDDRGLERLLEIAAQGDNED